MSSWIRCGCGRSLHRNLFCGAEVRLVVTDSFVDQLSEEGSARDCIERIVSGCDTLLSCPQCSRIVILSRDGSVSSYSLDHP